jgi:hypothetical protein
MMFQVSAFTSTKRKRPSYRTTHGPWNLTIEGAIKDFVDYVNQQESIASIMAGKEVFLFVSCPVLKVRPATMTNEAIPPATTMDYDLKPALQKAMLHLLELK